MRARRTVFTAAHWTAVTAVAFLLTELDPLTGMYAAGSDMVIALGVGLIGLATAPHTQRKDTRP
ncbi:hypothetical protein ACFZC6_02085 [Streptomyces ossamyceticus]|uniref:hypothetical protein n=1 Tax=Streptomyces ossamyceticus TaxID=249581 RepID=UPI0036E7FE08